MKTGTVSVNPPALLDTIAIFNPAKVHMQRTYIHHHLTDIVMVYQENDQLVSCEVYIM